MWNIITFYRIGNWFYRKRIPFFPSLFDFFIRLFFNSAVYSSCTIGQGTYFVYSGIGVVIHKKTIIGKNVMIGQGITIGGKLGKDRVPIIGDNVKITAGARIIGDITIGDYAVIGVNAVVTKDVPKYGVVAGVPAKLIKYRYPEGISPE